MLQAKREQVVILEQRLRDFLEDRPRLQAEWLAFQANGGGNLDDLKHWLRNAAEYPAVSHCP